MLRGKLTLDWLGRSAAMLVTWCVGVGGLLAQPAKGGDPAPAPPVATEASVPVFAYIAIGIAIVVVLWLVCASPRRN